MQIRNATNEDSQSLVELIGSVYVEYGDEIFLEGYDSDLLDVEASYVEKGGAFIVLLDQGEIIGSHAALPVDLEKGIVTHRRLYLRKDYRGGVAGAMLMDWAIDWDREHGFKRIEFWSDVRFERAHQFFEKFGFRKTGLKRDMDDGAMPYSEFQFCKDL